MTAAGMDSEQGDDQVDPAASRLEWARFVQKQQPDKLAAELIKVTEDGARRDRQKRRLRQAIGELAGQSSRPNPVLDRMLADQLHELDEPHTRGLLELHVEQLRGAQAERMGRDLGAITVSSLPAGEVTAMCSRDPGDQSLHIFADTELIILQHVLAKLVSRNSALVNSDGDLLPRLVVRRVWYDAQFFTQLTNFFSAVVFTGRARASTPWAADEVTATQAAILTWAMGRFATAHELAHGLEGHLDITEVGHASGDEGAVQKRQEQEIEADQVALEMCGPCISPQAVPELQLIAPYVFLKGIELLEVCQQVLPQTRRPAPSSHPATPKRLKTLKQAIIASPGKPVARLNRVYLLQHLDDLFAEWRSFCLPYLRDVEASGKAPHLERASLRDDRPRFLR